MNRMSVSQVLARVNARMVEPDLDVTGALASLLDGAAEALPVTAAAVLVELDGALEILAATSHQAAHIEIHQLQVDEGPCLDAIRSGRAVTASGDQTLAERWPVTGPAIVRAGFSSVQATPLRWQGSTFGGLNLFRHDSDSFEAQQAECRALADAITIILMARQLSAQPIADGLRDALEERAVVEQAKGALAHRRSLDMAAAFEELLALAQQEGTTLGVAARRVMEQARTGRLGE